MTKTNKKGLYAHQDILDGDACIYRRGDSNSNWQFRIWVDAEKKYLKKSLKTSDKVSALERARQIAIDCLTDVKMGKQIYSKNLQQVVELYLDKRLLDIDLNSGITKGRLKCIKSQMQHAIKMLGAKTKVNKIDKNAIHNYCYNRKKTANAKLETARNEVITFNAMWQWAYDEGHVHFKKFNLKKLIIKNKGRGRRDTFTDTEYRQLYTYMRKWVSAEECMTHENLIDRNHRDETTGRMCKGKLVFNKHLQLEREMVRDYILISANTGLRVGEARQLTWGDIVNIEEHIVDEETEEKQYLAKINVRWQTSKRREARTFHAKGGEYFKRLKERQQFTDDEHLIFSMDGKKSLSVDVWSKHWKVLMKGIGIEYHYTYLKDENDNFILDDDNEALKTGRNISYYSLRHTMITNRVKSNVPLIDIAKTVGTSFGHIEKTYLHYEDAQSRTSALKTHEKVNGMIIPLDNKKSKKKRKTKDYRNLEQKISEYVH